MSDGQSATPALERLRQETDGLGPTPGFEARVAFAVSARAQSLGFAFGLATRRAMPVLGAVAAAATVLAIASQRLLQAALDDWFIGMLGLS